MSVMRWAVVTGVLAGATPAMGTEVSGDVSGTWTLEGSPYELVGDVRVPPGETLTIEPGVVVIGKGNYKLIVEQSTLLALGTAEEPILMTAEDTDEGWRGIRLFSADDATTIQHCVIEYAKGREPTWPEVYGGAIYCENCSPTIAHNEMRFCFTEAAGAGVYLTGSSARVLHNHIHDNLAGGSAGILCVEYGSPWIYGNVIADNQADGAGGGIAVAVRCSPVIENNVIIRNRCDWSGAGINTNTGYLFYGTFPTIRGNIIAFNENTGGSSAFGGGGLYLRYDGAVLENNVIAYNTAREGGGIYVLTYEQSAPTVTNSILWGNEASVSGDQIFLHFQTGWIDVRYSDVQGGWSGTGNIDADPVFVDALNGDFHLAAGSPCIDAGDNAAVPADEWDLDDDGDTNEPIPFDLDGNPRFVDDPETEDTGNPHPEYPDPVSYTHLTLPTSDLV